MRERDEGSMDGDRAREQDREGETKTETETMTQTHTVNEIKCCFSECATLQNGPGSSGMRACMHACVQTDRTEPDRTGLTDGRRQTDRQACTSARVHAGSCKGIRTHPQMCTSRIHHYNYTAGSPSSRKRRLSAEAPLTKAPCRTVIMPGTSASSS